MKKENATISYATGFDSIIVMPSQKTTKKITFKKRFKKALARKLGVKYKAIKKSFPKCLNSTLIANHLAPLVGHFTHEEIRGICQELKLEFAGFR